MILVTQLFTAGAVLAASLALIAIWSPKAFSVKLLAVTNAVMLLPVGYVGLAGLLSKPKPVALEWFMTEATEAEVVGSRLAEGKGIFLWLQLPELEEPRAYVLPWDQETAEQLQQAMKEAEENNNGLRMRMPFEPSLDDREPRFYAMPQPALPPKDALDGGPEHYDHPGSQA
ncbi:MAG: hypothetical protein ACFB6S_12200 [Geminicoccaceae bacterium]